jgi:hypothetical protein
MVFYNNNTSNNNSIFLRISKFFIIKKQINQILMIISITSTFSILLNLTIYYKLNKLISRFHDKEYKKK